jgi:hypothetical protein
MAPRTPLSALAGSYPDVAVTLPMLGRRDHPSEGDVDNGPSPVSIG